MLKATSHYQHLLADYRQVAHNGGDFRMLKTLKIVRSIIVNLGIVGVTLYSLANTPANATYVSVLAILTLGLYNGVEVADYVALAEAFTQVKQDKKSE